MFGTADFLNSRVNRWLKRNQPGKREFLLTVDVEALPSRAYEEHVERLIWGDFHGHRESPTGLAEMLKRGDEHGVPVTCFLDMAEVYLYGDAIRDVGRHVHDAGHDLQLHLHPELLPAEYWEKAGFSAPERTQEFYSLARCRHVMSEFVGELRSLTDQRQVAAYRAGAFRIGRNMLSAQEECGIPISSNLSYRTFLNQKREPLAEPEAGVFQWDNGVLEVPVTQFSHDDQWNVLALPMNLPRGMNFRRLFHMIDNAAPPGPVVMLLHSWSLLKRERGNRRFSAPSMSRLRRFDRVLKEAAGIFEPISMSEFAARCGNGGMSSKPTVYFPEASCIE